MDCAGHVCGVCGVRVAVADARAGRRRVAAVGAGDLSRVLGAG